MKNLDNLEQPNNITSSQGEEVSQNEVRAEDSNIENGSKTEENQNFKFKSVEALAKAYDNLQSDYTKKCQALANLQREIRDNKEKSLPQNSYNNLQEELENFVLNNKDAKFYQGEMAKILLTNKEILKSQNPIEEAWKEVKQKNFISVEDVVKNSSFLNSYIQNNLELKNKIITDYFSTISKQDAPNLIKVSASSAVVTAKQKPKSIKEASKLVEDMFG